MAQEGDPMPTPDGKLDESEQARAIAWIKGKWPKHVCPICGTNAWGLEPQVVKMEVASSPLAIGGPYYPLIILFCANCAYAAAFGAIQMGIVQRDPQSIVDATSAAGVQTESASG
jgi:hypothetical protein